MNWTVKIPTLLLLACTTLATGRAVTTTEAPKPSLSRGGLRAGRGAAYDETPAATRKTSEADRDALAAALTAKMPAKDQTGPATKNEASESGRDAFASALSVEREVEREASEADRNAFASALAANMPTAQQEAPAKRQGPVVKPETPRPRAEAPRPKAEAPALNAQASAAGRDAFASALAANMPAADPAPSATNRRAPAEKRAAPAVERARPASTAERNAFASSLFENMGAVDQQAPAARPEATAAERNAFASSLFENMGGMDRQAPAAKREAPAAKREATDAERNAFASSLFENMGAMDRQAPAARPEATAAERNAFASSLFENMGAMERQAPAAKREAPAAKREAPAAGRDAFASALAANMPAADRMTQRSAPQTSRTASSANSARVQGKRQAAQETEYPTWADQLEQLWGTPSASRAEQAAHRKGQTSHFGRPTAAGHAAPSSLAQLQEEALAKLQHSEPMRQAAAATARHRLSPRQEEEAEEQALAQSVMDGFDANGDGKISLYELMEHVGDIHETHPEFKDWHSGFQEADQDDDMHLTLEELSSLLKNVGSQEEQLQIDDEKTRHASMAASIMEGLDANEDGKVSLQELLGNLNDEHHQMPEFKGWHKGFQQADADKDMHLTLDELANLLMAADEEEL